MSRRVGLATSLAAALMLGAQAQAQPMNEIRQHNPIYGGEPGPYWDIPFPNQVRILQTIPGETFEFEAVLLEAGQYVGPGFIDSIVANAGAGEVTITVVGHDLHPYGAEDIGEINLSAGGVTGTIDALDISGDLGALGPVLALTANSMYVAGALAGDLTCTTVGTLTVEGAVLASSTITVTDLVATLVFGADLASPPDFNGTLHLLHGIPEQLTLTQVVLIRGHLNGTIDLHGGRVRFRGRGTR